jgi:glycosyltransferase involved in cell wall biosynthesis
MKTAVVHDWLTGMRGGEAVLEEILDLVENPTIFTLFHFSGTVSKKIESVPIVRSFLQKLPISRSNYRNFLPLFPRAVESFDLTGFDLVVSTSHCVAKGARPKNAPHLCYCFTPVRYAHSLFSAYFRPGETRLYGLKKMFLDSLRRWDIRTSRRVDRFLADSSCVAERIRNAYGRESAVVFPPVDTEFFTPGSQTPLDFALCVGALVAYKGFDRAVAWANRTGLGLRIVGSGPEEKRLREMAGSSVEFESGLSREQLRERYRRCAFFLQPAEEDFGIASVEAQACGRPVVALDRGGIRDVIVSSGQGILYREESIDALSAAVDLLERSGSNPEGSRGNAERFSRANFRKEFLRHVSEMTP